MKTVGFTFSYGQSTNRITSPCKVTPCGMALNECNLNEGMTALWDTGSTKSAIDLKVAKTLGLTPIGRLTTHGIEGVSSHSTFMVDILLPDGFAIPSLEVMDSPLNGFDVLIGMDIISMGSFAISNFNGRTCFSFQIPSDKAISLGIPAEKEFVGIRTPSGQEWGYAGASGQRKPRWWNRIFRR